MYTNDLFSRWFYLVMYCIIRRKGTSTDYIVRPSVQYRSYFFFGLYYFLLPKNIPSYHVYKVPEVRHAGWRFQHIWSVVYFDSECNNSDLILEALLPQKLVPCWKKNSIEKEILLRQEEFSRLPDYHIGWLIDIRNRLWHSTFIINKIN